MNVTCPSCTTIYRVDPAKVPDGGVRARCKVCAAVFPVARSAPAVAGAPPAPMAPPPRVSPPPAATPLADEITAPRPAVSAPQAVPAAPSIVA